MRVRALVVVLFLVASLALGVFAFYSPKPSPPLFDVARCTAPPSQNGDPVMNGRASAACGAAVITYDSAMGAYYSSIWTPPELSQSLLFVALLCLVLPMMKAPESLKKRIALPRPLMLVPMLAGTVGFGVFAYAETFNVLYANSVSGYNAGNPTYLYYFSIDPQLPLYTVLGLVVASTCFGILRAKKGLSEGVKSAVVFCAFWVAVAQLCLLAFDYKEMYLHVTEFSSGWTLFGFPLLSNWFVLTMALTLTAWGVLLRK